MWQCGLCVCVCACSCMQQVSISQSHCEQKGVWRQCSSVQTRLPTSALALPLLLPHLRPGNRLSLQTSSSLYLSVGMFGVASYWPHFFPLSTCHSLHVNQKKQVFWYLFPLIFVKLPDFCVTVRAYLFPRKVTVNVYSICLFIAEACALQQYSHAIRVKTFSTNAISDTSPHISAKSRPSEPYINTYIRTRVASVALSCVVRSWPLIKAA